MSDFVIRYAGESDVSRIAEMEKICFPHDPWSYDMLYSDITKNPNVQFIVAETGGEIAGYLGMMRILDEADIINVAVAPECRRKHIAEAMLSYALDIAKEEETVSLTLEVRADNEPAIGLYEKLGFETEGSRKGYYAYDGMDAILMRLNIKKLRDKYEKRKIFDARDRDVLR